MTFPSFREFREVGQEIAVPCPKGAQFLAFHPFPDSDRGPRSFAIWFAGEKDAIEETRTFFISENDTPVNVAPKTIKHVVSAPLGEAAMFHLWEVV